MRPRLLMCEAATAPDAVRASDVRDLPAALELLRRLHELPVVIETVSAVQRNAPVRGYGSEGRPSAIVTAEGRGVRGSGEGVAWTVEDQRRLVERCAILLPMGSWRLEELSRHIRGATADPYERAAVELAAADLALRQAGTNLFRLAGRPPAPVSFLISFASLADPAGEIRSRRTVQPEVRVKLDVDPMWPDAVFAELRGLAAEDATRDSVAVLDLKLRGDLRLAERCHAAAPGALLEDPRLPSATAPPGTRRPRSVPPEIRARVAFDAPIGSAADIATLPLRPAAVNVKLGRLGGLTEALLTISECARSGIRVYVGGQFEVGVGRRHAQVLASLFSAGAWNDVAPLSVLEGDGWPTSPLAIPDDFTGMAWE